MENNEFEQGWKKAFDGAELTPGDGVWSGIESDLLSAENIRMRRSIVVYRRLAAALAIFGLVATALGFYYWRDTHRPVAALPAKAIPGSHTTTVTDKAPDVKERTAFADEQNSSPALPQIRSSNQEATPTQGRVDIADAVPGKEPTAASGVGATSVATNEPPPLSAASRNENQTPAERNELAASIKVRADSATEEATPVALHKKVVIAAQGRQQEGEKPEQVIHAPSVEETLWVAVGAATGSYYPGAGQPDYSRYSFPNLSNPLSNRESSSGAATSYWLSVGRRLSKRWVVQAGLSYLHENVGFTSNLVVAGASPTAYVAIYNTTGTTAAQVTTTSPYAINSVLEYLSIPIQAGFILVDHRIGVQLNSGAAADFFLQNSLQDQTGHAGRYSKGPGSDSPYRSLNWSGLANAELSYKVTSRYRLSVVPGMRYSFQSALKSGADHPHTMDIGFRFRYILR